jgi:hypothetical protein
VCNNRDPFVFYVVASVFFFGVITFVTVCTEVVTTQERSHAGNHIVVAVVIVQVDLLLGCGFMVNDSVEMLTPSGNSTCTSYYKCKNCGQTVKNEWEIIPVETSIARLVKIIIHLDTSVTCSVRQTPIRSSHMLGRYCLYRRLDPCILNTLYVLHIAGCRVRMIDSINVLPSALSELPKMFGLEELKKGYFPHLFNRKENQSVVLNHLPDVHYYHPDAMKQSCKHSSAVHR